MRIAFVIVPSFVFTAHAGDGGPLVGCREDLVDRAVVVDGDGGRASVMAMSKVLRGEGVRSGMTVAKARSKAGFVWTVSFDPLLVARRSSELSGVLLAASPQIHVGGSGVFWVGASGFRLLGGEHALIDLIDELVTSVGYEPPRIGVADTVIGARAAALHRLDVIPPGEDAEAMAPLPLSVLPLDGRARDALWALGIRSVGAFSALPVSQVLARFGADAEKALRLAKGEDPRAVSLRQGDDSLAIEVDFETPFEVVEPALFVLRGGMDALVAQHSARGFGVQRLELELKLTDGCWVREVKPPEPVTSASRLVEMCHGLLQDVELPSMMEGIRVSVTEVAPAAVQQEGLWDGGRRRGSIAIDVTLMRLQSRLGVEAVKTPGLRRDEHLPDHMASWDEVEPHASPRAQDVIVPSTQAAWRLKRPPRELLVRHERGLPVKVHWEESWAAIRTVAGPQRVETHWWESCGSGSEEGVDQKAESPLGIRRDYWYAQMRSGPALSLFRDLNTEVWFLQAVLD